MGNKGYKLIINVMNPFLCIIFAEATLLLSILVTDWYIQKSNRRRQTKDKGQKSWTLDGRLRTSDRRVETPTADKRRKSLTPDIEHLKKEIPLFNHLIK